MFVRRQVPSPTTLLFNTGATSATGIAAPPLTGPIPSTSTETSIPVNTIPISMPIGEASSDSIPEPSQQPGVATTSTPSTINLGTVIGACLGSFALLLILILLVVWHSRRSRKASLPLRDHRTKRDNWNKLTDNSRDSRRSSFESKPSLPHSSLEYMSDYPPKLSQPLPNQLLHNETDVSRYTLPAHPYSSSHSVLPSGNSESRTSPDGNPFTDPDHTSKSRDTDVASLYSTSSNPFESVYSPPTDSASRINATQGFSGSPFFTPHPDSSVEEEKWGSVGKERNVQQSYAAPGPEATDKLGSLIAALDLSASGNDEVKADSSMHGHLGRFVDD